MYSPSPMARYTVVEAARRLGVSKDTLLRWEKQKKIPAAPRLRRSGHRVYDDALDCAGAEGICGAGDQSRREGKKEEKSMGGSPSAPPQTKFQMPNRHDTAIAAKSRVFPLEETPSFFTPCFFWFYPFAPAPSFSSAFRRVSSRSSGFEINPLTLPCSTKPYQA
jgi:excisionase family DNA binding protein